MSELIAAQLEGGYKRVCEVSGNCPACKLATFRLSVLPSVDEDNQSWEIGDWDAFNFKQEKAAVWAEHNSAKEHDFY